MKLALHRFGLFLVIAVLLPRALPSGQEQQQQGEQMVIRFIRDPDPAAEFAVKGIDGGTVNLAAARGCPWKSGAVEFLGHVVRAMPDGGA